MKKTLAVVIAALFLLTTPLLVAAHDAGQNKAGPDRHERGWQRDRHQVRNAFRNDRVVHPRGYRAERPHRKPVPKHHAHYQREQRQRYPVYAAGPAVIFGAPRIVFRIDW